MMKGKLKIAIITLLVVWATTLPGLAHSPLFPVANHDLKNAFPINNPTKSWAIYTRLAQPGKIDYYKFKIERGAPIALALMTSKRPSTDSFQPSLLLMVPLATPPAGPTGSVTIPDGYSIKPLIHQPSDQPHYEPFSPGWYYEIGRLKLAAPLAGTYYLAVYDRQRQAGNYLLAVGATEAFTLREWLIIPANFYAIYVWEGQHHLLIWLPLLLVWLAGGLLLWRRRQLSKPPRDLAQWLLAGAGLAFWGSAAGTSQQMLTALAVTGWTAAFGITLILISSGLLLGLLSLRYAFRNPLPLTWGSRSRLLVIGILGLLLWSGIYLGPTLAILAAVLPQPKTA